MYCQNCLYPSLKLFLRSLRMRLMDVLKCSPLYVLALTFFPAAPFPLWSLCHSTFTFLCLCHAHFSLSLFSLFLSLCHSTFTFLCLCHAHFSLSLFSLFLSLCHSTFTFLCLCHAKFSLSLFSLFLSLLSVYFLSFCCSFSSFSSANVWSCFTSVSLSAEGSLEIEIGQKMEQGFLYLARNLAFWRLEKKKFEKLYFKNTSAEKKGCLKSGQQGAVFKNIIESPLKNGQ
jgi:hypothetical protein